MDIPPRIEEVYHLDLGKYWCENHLATADFDRDGWTDIVLMVTGLRDTSGPPWTYKSKAILLRNQGNGGFADSVIADYPANYGYFAGAADLNNDGAPDLVLRESSASHVLLNDGSGSAFQEVFTFKPGYYGLAFADVNRDGFQDLVSGTQTDSGGVIELFLNDGTGRSFTKTWASRLYGSSIETVLSVNLNGDARPDIAAREIYTGKLVTLLGTDTGDSFVEKGVLEFGGRTFALAGGNVNGDSLTDLAAYVGWGQVRVLVNRGDGSLAADWQSPWLGQAAYGLALADFDGDGFDDVFVGTFGDGALRIYRNNPGAGFELWWQGRLPGQGFTGTVADLNGDGDPDLVAGEMNGIRLYLNGTCIPRMKCPSMVRGFSTLAWSARKGSTYRVEYKARFDKGEWLDLNGDVVASGFTASKEDHTVESSRQRIYRVIELP